MAKRRTTRQGRLFEKKLFYGDNLRILRMPEHFTPESVDLVYLDPPFKPNEQYNVLFRDQGDAVPSAAQVRAFEDTWRWGAAARDAYNDVQENAPHHVRRTLEALQRILGRSNMFAYLAMMAPRLVELHKVMKRTASIYLHCDHAASHYLKVLMDAVFEPENFVNEIVWKRSSAHSDVVQGARHYGRIHDTLLFYSKTSDRIWNTSYSEYAPAYVEKTYRYTDPDGRRFQTQPLHAAKPGGDTLYEWKGQHPPPGRFWAFSKAKMAALDKEGRIAYSRTGVPRYKIYLDEAQGVPAQDLWTDIAPVHHRPKERLRYPTQKPRALLERIISTSSNPGGVVLDPFCGCGTSIDAAEALGREWVGIDVAYDAIPIIRGRLDERGLQDRRDYEVWGLPETVEDAAKLAKENPYQFEWWAVRRLGAKENEHKKGKDKGVDGRLALPSAKKGSFPEAIVSVKAGQTGPAHVRDLAGTIKAQEAEVGVLVVLKTPTPGMREAAEDQGGYIDGDGTWYPRIQILTAQDILAGTGARYPSGVRVKPAASQEGPRSPRGSKRDRPRQRPSRG